jgi:hypothetical protein
MVELLLDHLVLVDVPNGNFWLYDPIHSFQ